MVLPNMSKHLFFIHPQIPPQKNWHPSLSQSKADFRGVNRGGLQPLCARCLDAGAFMRHDF